MCPRLDPVIRECYVCGQPVHRSQVARVPDVAVSALFGRPITRVVHRGECALEALARIGPRPEERGDQP